VRRAVRPAPQVNASLDAETSAIETRYASLKAAGTNPKRLPTRLVGAFTGPRDLSTNYKKYLLEALAKKHGYR